MTYALSFIAGIFIGGLIGVFMMCCLTASGQADDREEAWFDDEQRSG